MELEHDTADLTIRTGLDRQNQRAQSPRVSHLGPMATGSGVDTLCEFDPLSDLDMFDLSSFNATHGDFDEIFAFDTADWGLYGWPDNSWPGTA